LPKCPTGIAGLDQITAGGLPRGRPTLVCGSAGCGKTLLAMEFLIRGATEFNEPGVCITFEERPEDLSANVASLGFDVDALVRARKLMVDYVHIERSEIEETGEYDLAGLFVRMGSAIDAIGAKRVALDSVESLFGGLGNESVLRAELRRLFRWLKDKGVTAVVTGERGDRALTRYGLEEYISDCVILLDHRVENSVFTRRLRVVKYRGSTHGTNDYPFLIDEKGMSVLPVTSLTLEHKALKDYIPSGVPDLDEMLGGNGFYRGSSIMISGTSGTGKTSLAASFVRAAVERGERALLLAFEESRDQWLRNMASIGIHLAPAVAKGLLRHEAARPNAFGLEMHLVRLHKTIEEFRPSVVVFDPITALLHAGSLLEIQAWVLRLVDYMKGMGITVMLTMLTDPRAAESTELGISSLVDAWVLLRDIELGGERNRGVYVLKARGMAHSNQIREFLISADGIAIRPAYMGEDGVLTGSARLARETRDRAAEASRLEEIERRRILLESKRKQLDAQIEALRFDLQSESAGLERLMYLESKRKALAGQGLLAMAASRRSVAPKRRAARGGK
jgi:circadian clock protein KaiC